MLITYDGHSPAKINRDGVYMNITALTGLILQTNKLIDSGKYTT